MIGVTVAQLLQVHTRTNWFSRNSTDWPCSRLQHSPQPNLLFGFYVLGKPLSCICHGAAIYTLGIGAFRTWRSQNAILRGKAISGGFEIVFLAGGVLVVSPPTQGISIPKETSTHVCI
jgi:hypothetical protein